MKTFALALLSALQTPTVRAFAIAPVPPSAARTDARFLGSPGHAAARRPLAMTATTSEEIIPRAVLFGNPKNASPQISPDGTYLAYLAPSAEDDVLNIFVRAAADDDNDGAVMVTSETSRGIRQYQWAQDGETLLYLQDVEGDENFHLWAVAANGEGAPRDLTPGENVKASNLITNKRFPDELLVGTNERDPAVFDMYRVQYKTGERTLDTTNPGDVLGWGAEDATFQIREALVKDQADSSETIRVRDHDGEGAEWRDLITHPVRRHTRAFAWRCSAGCVPQWRRRKARCEMVDCTAN